MIPSSEKYPLQKFFPKAIGVISSCFIVWLLIAAVYGSHTILNAGGFTSDGFHYYSTLRNFVSSRTSYEGPIFEYMLGNHAYLTIFLLSPIVGLAKSPFALALIQISLHFATAFLIFLCARNFVNAHYQFATSILLSLLYLVFPLVASTLVLTPFLFQPDFIVAPLILLLFYSINTNKKLLPVICGLLIIYTKEELVVLLPIYVVFVLHLRISLDSKTYIKKTFTKTFFYFFAIYSIATLSILILMNHYHSLNHLNHAGTVSSRVKFDQFLILSTYLLASAQVLKLLLPIFPAVLLIFFNLPSNLSKSKFLFWLLAFPFGRFVLNQSIYGDPIGTSWGNSALPSLIFICLIYGMSNMTKPLRKVNLVAWILILCVGCCLLIDKSSPSIREVVSSLDGSFNKRYSTDDILSIEKCIRPPQSYHNYFIVDEYFMAPFMGRSHVSTSWLVSRNPIEMNAILINSDFIIVEKTNSPLSSYIAEFPANFVLQCASKKIQLLRYQSHPLDNPIQDF